MGGNFESVPECVPGKHLEPLTCCHDPLKDTEYHLVHCYKGEDNCAKVTAQFMACGGPIYPFLLDDEENIYFWNARWHFQSIDKNGNFRWRYDFCNPEEDTFCITSEDCYPNHSRNVPTFMDYHNTIYFFLGSHIFALNTDGELIFKRKINNPLGKKKWGIASIGEESHHSSMWSPGAQPFLTVDGNIGVTFYSEINGSDKGTSGWMLLNRTGEILKYIDFKSNFKEPPSVTPILFLLLKEEKVLFTGYGRHIDPKTDEYKHDELKSYFLITKEEKALFYEETKVDFLVNGSYEKQGNSDRIRPQMALSDSGMAIALSEYGSVYAVDTVTMELKRIFNFQYPNLFSFHNRPVFDENGDLYLVYDPTVGVLWSFDTAYLWDYPYSKMDKENPVSLDSVPGVNWMTPPNPAVREEWKQPEWEGKWRGNAGPGYSTPVLSKNKRLYTALGQIYAIDRESGEKIWNVEVPSSCPSAGIILSDGTIVVGCGQNGRVYFIKEDVENGGPLEAGWPMAHHDRYHSNNSQHPFNWDKTKSEPPYPSLEQLLSETDGCVNELEKCKKNENCSCQDITCSKTGIKCTDSPILAVLFTMLLIIFVSTVRFFMIGKVK